MLATDKPKEFSLPYDPNPESPTGIAFGYFSLVSRCTQTVAPVNLSEIESLREGPISLTGEEGERLTHVLQQGRPARRAPSARRADEPQPR